MRGAIVDEPWRSLPRPWVVDVGSGGDPFPLANILVDKHPEDGTKHRNTKFRTDGKLLVVADVEALPFETGSIDFAWCSHVLEHTDRPDIAVGELIRVARQGVAWVPTIYAETVSHMLHPGKESGHKWLCLRERNLAWVFLRCPDENEEEIRAALRSLGVWNQAAAWGYGTEIRIAWGWGGWPDKPMVTAWETRESWRESLAKMKVEEQKETEATE